MKEVQRVWEFMVDNLIATENELDLVTDICGYNIDTLNDVLYARTGYRNIEQMKGEY